MVHRLLSVLVHFKLRNSLFYLPLHIFAHFMLLFNSLVFLHQIPPTAGVATLPLPPGFGLASRRAQALWLLRHSGQNLTRYVSFYFLYFLSFL